MGDPMEKVTLALSFLAYEQSKQDINDRLQSLAPSIGKYHIVWGPAFHRDHWNKHQYDAMTYIVQNSNNPTEFYVAIRGTAPLTISEWIFQDLWVGKMVAWEKVPYHRIIPPPQPAYDTPAIAAGTNYALNILVNHLEDQNEDIYTFLLNQAIQSEHPIIINVTGHSLGGVLAPTFALYLNDKWPTHISKPSIYSYGYAGPTAGNKKFAAYSNARMGHEVCKRYANPLDLVPNAWNLETMKKMPDIYGSSIRMEPLLAKIFTKIALPAIRDKEYTQIDENPITINSEVKKFLPLYLAQAAYQHIIPYHAEFLRLCPATNQGQLINLLESCAMVKSFKKFEALSNGTEYDLRYYLNLLSL